jgi:hypothetical protein
VIPPGAPAVPGGPPGTVTSGPVPRGLGIAGRPAALAADLIVPPMRVAEVPPAAARLGPMTQTIVCSSLV